MSSQENVLSPEPAPARPLFGPDAVKHLLPDPEEEVTTPGYPCSIWDENIPGCDDYYEGTIFFTRNAVHLAYLSEMWQYPQRCINYVPCNPKKINATLRHPIGFRGVHYVVRTADTDFTIVGQRRDVHVRFCMFKDSQAFCRDLDKNFDLVTRVEFFEEVCPKNAKLFEDILGHFDENLWTFWANIENNADSHAPEAAAEFEAEEQALKKAAKRQQQVFLKPKKAYSLEDQFNGEWIQPQKSEQEKITEKIYTRIRDLVWDELWCRLDLCKKFFRDQTITLQSLNMKLACYKDMYKWNYDMSTRLTNLVLTAHPRLLKQNEAIREVKYGFHLRI